MIGEVPLSTFMFRKGVSEENILIFVGSLNIIIYTVLLHFFYTQFSSPSVIAVFILFVLVFFVRLNRIKSNLAKQTK